MSLVIENNWIFDLLCQYIRKKQSKKIFQQTHIKYLQLTQFYIKTKIQFLSIFLM